MTQYTVLFNPHADSGRGESESRALCRLLPDAALEFHDMTAIADYAAFFQAVPAARRVVIAGGDGTLNRFLNDTAGLSLPHTLYYFACGSGNDFLRDVGRERGTPPFCIDRYIRNLPEVTVNGRTYRVLNGVGYGIDGYCCEEGDRRRAAGVKKINYTAIAVKGLLFHYRPTGATVTVDGVRRRYEKVWLAPTMHGRFYGGGMIPTPEQDRFSESGSVSTMIFHGSGKLKTLRIFPSIFQGDHIRRTDAVEVLTGHDVTVEFDRPTPLQIDGETISGVRAYHVAARVPAAVS